MLTNHLARRTISGLLIRNFNTTSTVSITKINPLLYQDENNNPILAYDLKWGGNPAHTPANLAEAALKRTRSRSGPLIGPITSVLLPYFNTKKTISPDCIAFVNHQLTKITPPPEDHYVTVYSGQDISTMIRRIHLFETCHVTSFLEGIYVGQKSIAEPYADRHSLLCKITCASYHLRGATYGSSIINYGAPARLLRVSIGESKIKTGSIDSGFVYD